MIKFMKNLFKRHKQLNISVVMCSVCGGKNIQITKHKKITVPPPGTKINRFRKTTYGYFFKRYTCECGNVWEVRGE